MIWRTWLRVTGARTQRTDPRVVREAGLDASAAARAPTCSRVTSSEPWHSRSPICESRAVCCRKGNGSPHVAGPWRMHLPIASPIPPAPRRRWPAGSPSSSICGASTAFSTVSPPPPTPSRGAAPDWAGGAPGMRPRVGATSEVTSTAHWLMATSTPRGGRSLPPPSVVTRRALRAGWTRGCRRCGG